MFSDLLAVAPVSSPLSPSVWLLGNLLCLCPPLSYLSPAAVAASVHLWADLLPDLPQQAYVQPVPIVHVRAGAHEVVLEMPRVLVLQVCRRGCGPVCVWCCVCGHDIVGIFVDVVCVTT